MSRLKMACILLALPLAHGCSRETRPVEADQPQTPPAGADDPRAAHYEENAYQISQGGRYAGWYGCGACHGVEARGDLDLGDGRWTHGGALDQVYAFITHGHPGDLGDYGARIPVEQLWQITAYVRDLPNMAPEKRRRQAAEQAGEPQGRDWSGPLR